MAFLINTQTILSALIYLVFLKFAASVQPSGWTCGGDDFAEMNTEFFINKDCPHLKYATNWCCMNHEACYQNRWGQEYCDAVYCNCIASVMSGHDKCSMVISPMFCNHARWNGPFLYMRAG